MKTLVLFPVIAVGFIAGCASSNNRQSGPYVNPAMIMLTADQAESRGIVLKPAEGAPPAGVEVHSKDTASVSTQAQIKVYTMGRTVDPVDPNVMHEAHVVYRRESSARWKLQDQPAQLLAVGPRLADTRTEQQPAQNQEIDSYLADARKAQQEDRQALETLYKGMDALSQQQRQLLRLVVEGMAKQEQKKPEEAPKESPAPAKPTGTPEKKG